MILVELYVGKNLVAEFTHVSLLPLITNNRGYHGQKSIELKNRDFTLFSYDIELSTEILCLG